MTIHDILTAAKCVKTETALRATSQTVLAWIATMPEHPLTNAALTEIYRRRGESEPIILRKKSEFDSTKVAEIMVKMVKYNTKLLTTISNESNSPLWKHCATLMLSMPRKS